MSRGRKKLTRHDSITRRQLQILEKRRSRRQRLRFDKIDTKLAKIVCVVAAHRRGVLLKNTLRQLQAQSRPFEKIIVVGDSNVEKQISDAAGTVFLMHKNRPLGKKWQAGIDLAREYSPDVVMTCASNSWLTSNWNELLVPRLKRFDVVGKNDFYVCRFGQNRPLEVIHRRYDQKRSDVPLGSGRMFSKYLLESMNWSLYNPDKERLLDTDIIKKIRKTRGAIYIANSVIEAKLCGVKCDVWNTITTFKTLKYGRKLDKIEDVGDCREWLFENYEQSGHFIKDYYNEWKESK